MRRTQVTQHADTSRNVHRNVVGELTLTAIAPALTSPLRKPAPYGRPVHRLGDCAGRSPGSRVVAQLRPAFPVSQWPYGRGLAAHSCGGSHWIDSKPQRANSNDPCSLFRPRCDPGNQHVKISLERHERVKRRPLFLARAAPARRVISAATSGIRAVLCLTGWLIRFTCLKCFTCLTCLTAFTCLMWRCALAIWCLRDMALGGMTLDVRNLLDAGGADIRAALVGGDRRVRAVLRSSAGPAIRLTAMTAAASLLNMVLILCSTGLPEPLGLFGRPALPPVVAQQNARNPLNPFWKKRAAVDRAFKHPAPRCWKPGGIVAEEYFFRRRD